MKTGFIGLGAMGGPMARNLERAGWLTAAWNRTPERAREWIEDTGRIAASPREVAQRCELIVLSVSRDRDVLEMVETLAPALQAGAIVADTSTVGSRTAVQAADTLARRDAHFLDCPVSGGVEGARNATLVMMAGGAQEALERARPALSAIAANVVHIGPTGSGQAAKAVNQLMAAGINQAVTEALAFGETLGLDMQRVVETIAQGAAGNWFLGHRGKSMLQGRYAPGFKVALHQKDLEIVRVMAAEHGIALPLAEATRKDYARLMAEGHGDEDISALFRLKRREPDSRPG